MLADQHLIPGLRNLCGHACVVNILQAASALSGRELIADPTNFLAEVFASSSNPARGLSPETSHAMLTSFLSERFANLNVRLRTFVDDFNVFPEGIPVIPITPESLLPRGRNFRILAIGSLTASGELRQQSGHAVILGDFDRKKLTFIDPNMPYQNFEAEYLGQNERGFPIFQITKNPSQEDIRYIWVFSHTDLEVN